MTEPTDKEMIRVLAKEAMGWVFAYSEWRTDDENMNSAAWAGWNPFKNANDTLAVIEAMCKKGFIYTRHSHWIKDHLYHNVSFGKEGHGLYEYKQQGQDFKRAVCTAAYKAIEERNDG